MYPKKKRVPPHIITHLLIKLAYITKLITEVNQVHFIIVIIINIQHTKSEGHLPFVFWGHKLAVFSETI